MSEHDDRIAIVGMAGRFPRAGDVRALWTNLRDGIESVRFFSDEELLESGVDPALLTDPNYVRGCQYLDDADLFDATFFDINPREAELTDPQQRIFLECAWEALESACIDPERYEGQIAVFAGSGRNNYVLDNILTNERVMESMGVVAAALQNEKDFLSTRVSYKFNLKGPAVTVQTACSTSLVAVHLGSQALMSGECDAVLAGGVCVAALKKAGYLYIDGGIFARDGHLRAFDAGASGQVGGNGCAIVVLKRLEDALANGDTVHAVIRGSALNNDGIQKVSFSAPGVDGQARVIVEALAVAGVHPEDLDYVECHGTGTQLGDPIEVAALTQAFRTRTTKTGFCPIGSLKTNVGHLDAAAGVAGIIKTALALEHEALPASLNFETPNPEIDFASSPFYVNTKLSPWQRGSRPRIAGVSSFGMGGTNAHVVLEEAPLPAPTSSSRKQQLLLVSARNPAALDANAQRLAARLEESPELDLADVAFTLQVGRKAFELRRAVVADTTAAAAQALRSPDPTSTIEGRAPKGGRPVAFCFSGQGAQYADMARGLYDAEPCFRAALDEVLGLLQPHLAGDNQLADLLFPAPDAPDAREAADASLARTELTQPALFAVEYALARLLASFGIQPDAMLGHSIGEYVAATLAGVFTLPDACRIVAARGRLIGSLPDGGAMLAVHLSEDELRPHLGDQLSLAAINAPGLCVASGPEAAIAALENGLAAAQVSTRRLHTSHAFHSALMDPILASFEAELAAVTLSPPSAHFVSCTTGTWIEDHEATDPRYWVRHLREAVRFADGVRTLIADKPRALLEVGPGKTLATLARLGVDESTSIATTTRHPHADEDDLSTLLRGIGALWTAGVSVDWQAFSAGETRRRLPLPAYAFQRERYWVEPGLGGPAASASRRKITDVGRWFYAPSWRRATRALETRPDGHGWLVFADRGGLAHALIERLKELGNDVLVVESGTSFQSRGNRGFTIDPRNPADYTDLFDELRERGFQPGTIAHLWSVDPHVRTSLDALDQVQELGFYSLLFLAQALAAHGAASGDIRLGVFTRGAQEVLGGELDQPEKATVLGSCKAIDSELSDVSCTCVDLDEAAAALQVERILGELGCAAREPVVAYRNTNRWIPDFQPVLLPTPAAPAQVPPRLRQRGVYLVTGGLGGIGLALAQWLARTAQARLVLLGRSAIPDESGWDAWISEHGAGDATSRKIGELRHLQELGAEVLAVSADVTDPDALRDVVDQACARFGAVHGVIHSAGLPGAGLIELKSRGAARKVLAPKVRGTHVLEEVFRDQQLDFLALCSSLASAIVGVGQVDYFAANAYLDAFAWHARSRGLPVVSINWDAWTEVGMAVNTVVPEALRQEREENLRTGITPAEGQDAFARILDADLPQVLVSTRELFARVEEIRQEVQDNAAPGAPTDTDEAAPAAPRKGLHARPALSTVFVAAETETERAVASMWGDLLGIDGIGRDDDVFELGGNSLLLMQLSVRIRSLFGVNLPLRSLFELKTAGTLAEKIDTLRMAADVASEDGVSDDTEEVSL